MVRFIRYWIERSMEDPAAREEAARKHLEKVVADAEKLKDRWAQPPKPAGYWNSRAATSPTAHASAQAEADLLSPYAKLLREMDDAKRAADEK